LQWGWGPSEERKEATTKEVASFRKTREVMRGNRKRAPLRVGTVSKSVLICACIAGIGLTYVWQKDQIYRLGDEIKRREGAIIAAEKRNTMLAAQVAQLKSPSMLELRCQQYGLSLVAPREQQMVRLMEPGPEWDVKLIPTAAPAQPIAPARKRPAAKSQPKTVARR